MSWVGRGGWPFQATVVLTPQEEQLDRETVARMTREMDAETAKQDVEDSLRQSGRRYCDECGCWFHGKCLCADIQCWDSAITEPNE